MNYHYRTARAGANAPFPYVTPSYLDTRILFGTGASRLLAPILFEELGICNAKRPFLITGRRTAGKPWLAEICGAVVGFGGDVIENDTRNPTFESIKRLTRRARAFGADYIVAVGGGSAIDAAKAVTALLVNDMSLNDLLKRKDKSMPAVPILALPSTAGTGSEVTSSASIWDADTKLKFSLSAQSLYPRVAIVDPALTRTVSRSVAAGTGLDALAHGVESSLSVNSSDESIEHGLKAIRLITGHLADRLSDRCSALDLEAVSRASLEAGLAIAKGKTTISHAISYPLTARYGVHHGHACSLSLGELLIFNSEISDRDCLDARGTGHVRKVISRILEALGAETPKQALGRIRFLIKSGGLKCFDEYPEFDLSLIGSDVVHYDRFENNPRAMSRKQLNGLLGRLIRKPATIPCY